ncbi:MAG: toll/interleukin-1 receptor domain-containing protein, partial [Hyphomicrobiaceae bacterium]
EPRRTRDSNAIRIFINYRREDTEAAAGRLHDRLSLDFGNEHVFSDTDDIPAGTDFIEHLARQIDQCDVFLAVIGRGWVTAADAAGNQRLADAGDFVRREIHSALARGIPVIPVLVDGASMPCEDQMPASLSPLRRRQAVEIRNGQFAADAARLSGKVREAIELDRQADRRRM